jgi:hypothetical protein
MKKLPNWYYDEPSHAGELVDAVESNVALRHLPDFWKQIGLNNWSQLRT